MQPPLCFACFRIPKKQQKINRRKRDDREKNIIVKIFSDSYPGAPAETAELRPGERRCTAS